MLTAPARLMRRGRGSGNTAHSGGATGNVLSHNCHSWAGRSSPTTSVPSDQRDPILLFVKLAIYCADIGSVPNDRFGWARNDTAAAMIEEHRGGTEVVDLVDAVAEDLAMGWAVALGFECPLFVPVPREPFRLGMARHGERNRSWSAGAGAGVLATGLVQVAWILSELRSRRPGASPHLDWGQFTNAGSGLFLWEAFVSRGAKATTHLEDATVAVSAFRAALPDPTHANAITTDRPLSLLGAAILWSGWTDDVKFLRMACLVIRAAESAATSDG
jgi:hypothetical protein